LNEKVDLKKLEKKAYTAYHGDGILDLMLGFVIVWITFLLAIIPDFFIFAVSSFVALLPAYTSAKNSFTVPRMGYVEFSATRLKSTRTLFLIFNVIFIFCVLAGMLAWLVPPVTVFILTYYAIIVGSVGGAIFCVTGFISGISRFYGYGLVLFAGFVIAQVFTLSILLPIFAFGILMIASGGFLLYRFTRKYPKDSETDREEQFPA
jgi:hypothetical protein